VFAFTDGCDCLLWLVFAFLIASCNCLLEKWPTIAQNRVFMQLLMVFLRNNCTGKNESSLNFLQKVSFSSPDFEFAAIRPHKVDLPLYTAGIT
jgi:hypothetical protein